MIYINNIFFHYYKRLSLFSSLSFKFSLSLSFYIIFIGSYSLYFDYRKISSLKLFSSFVNRIGLLIYSLSDKSSSFRFEIVPSDLELLVANIGTILLKFLILNGLKLFVGDFVGLDNPSSYSSGGSSLYLNYFNFAVLLRSQPNKSLIILILSKS